jgi:hypothetical protein
MKGAGRSNRLKVDDGTEADGVEAGSADECAVDVGLRHETFDIVGLYAAAVEDTGLGGSFRAVLGGYQTAEVAVCGGCHVGGCGLAGSDGPDGFVGDSDLSELRIGEGCDASIELRLEDGLRAAGFALFETFADTDDGFESVFECGEGAFADGFFRFAEILTAFTMADDDPFTSDTDEHGAGDLAGIGAFLGPKDVLRADLDVGSRRGGYGRGDVDKRSPDDDIGVGRLRHEGKKFFEESSSFGGSFVHLPIAGHEWFTHKSG